MNSVAAELQQKCIALESELRQKESELVTLRELTQDLSQDVQAAKIIELSKKNRQLNLMLEREKQRVAQLQAEAAAGPPRPASGQAGGGGPSAPPPEAIEQIARGMVEQAAEAAEAAQKEAAGWKDKFLASTNKIAQMEQKVFNLESENKKLTRALVREVGEDVPLSKLMEDGNAAEWKGRREQIIALQYQVKQLKAAAGQVAVETKQEAAAKGVITKISKERNNELDRLTGDLGAVRGELEALKLKYDGAISRRKILEAELSSMKSKVSVVLEKTETDDKLIAALKQELAALRKAGPGGAPALGRGGKPSNPAGPIGEEDLWREVGSLRRKVQEQEEQIDRQEAIIMALQQRASAGSTPTAGAGRPGSGGMPPRGGQWDGGAADQQIRLLEVENARLTELVALLQRRAEGAA
ncbi:hypothetical protein HYH03_002968 [Edaphochlamys debaryana]|uniref:Uncharacterized protein n=1 Tax=Edaphochlamys debaryana TaxID=47281 RepID=A0A835YCW5_9CHLO|nr:hypothetical protein HYH03_002968 [Edaphochlamys debaryana]|eukprot:KAG2499394.1 hypothetical protein HYH03_002968 [Edaphochlamys debaryana]